MEHFDVLAIVSIEGSLTEDIRGQRQLTFPSLQSICNIREKGCSLFFNFLYSPLQTIFKGTSLSTVGKGMLT